MVNCLICNKKTKNKKYCSRECQYKDYRGEKKDRLITICLYCDGEFKTLKNKLDNGKSKYCSRSCKDKHQKILYKGENNPVFNKKYSEKHKKFKSDLMKEKWKDLEFINKVKDGQSKFLLENGFWCGTDEKSIKKKIETNLERYGVECVLKLEKYKKIREEICLKKYGKTSLELAREALKKTKITNIEGKISKILISKGIKFETQYDLYYSGSKYKTYDFYLKDFNLLIEADGDYWHGNPKKYKMGDLNETQMINKKNDIFKNKLAKENGFKLLRYWEEDIKRNGFKNKIFNDIKNDKN